MILCMTLRQKFADIFWFTLFHEIAHILNGDTKHAFIDIGGVSRQKVNAIENNKYDLTLSLAFNLAKELQVTVDELFKPS